MGINGDLNARPDTMWQRVDLTVRGIHLHTLRQLAEVAAKDPEKLLACFEELAGALDYPTEGWDTAAADFEANVEAIVDEPLGFGTAVLSEAEARQLAVELTDAADLTFSARMRAAGPFPQQQDRRAA